MVSACRQCCPSQTLSLSRSCLASLYASLADASTAGNVYGTCAALAWVSQPCPRSLRELSRLSWPLRALSHDLQRRSASGLT